MSLDRDREEAGIEQALHHFRGSVKAWSDAEFAMPRQVRRSRWGAMWMVMARPAVSGAFAVVLAGASIGVPVAVHQQHVIAEQRQEALNRQKALDAKKAQERTAQAMDDADLMTEVDSDIAQEAPDAMQPLASLMSDSGSRQTAK